MPNADEPPAPLAGPGRPFALEPSGVKPPSPALGLLDDRLPAERASDDDPGPPRASRQSHSYTSGCSHALPGVTSHPDGTPHRDA